MRILVVSGFLGAGKTTFIKELARRTGRDFVVYENEYGQVDIDAKELSQSDELSVWESTENCICCSGQQDFSTSVLTIANVLDPEYLIVEPTGAARLSAILDNIDRVSYERISMMDPIAIVDTVAWERQSERFADIFQDQVATASVVVLSKVQHAGAGQLEAVSKWVREMNPTAEVTDVPYDQLEDAWFEGLLSRCLEDGAHRPGDGRLPSSGHEHADGCPPADEELESLSLVGIALPTENHLIWLLDAVVSGVFGDIVRAKGTLPCGSQWLRFDVVDRAWSITGSNRTTDGESDEAAGVFIGQGLRRPWLREAFQPLVGGALSRGLKETDPKQS